jgi:hypothetical protein
MDDLSLDPNQVADQPPLSLVDRLMCADGSEIERRETVRYFKEFGPAMAAYMASVIGVSFVVDSQVEQARNYLALVPLVPVILAAVAVYRSVRRVDEYARHVQVSWMAVGFGVAMVGLVGLMLLSMADLMPPAGPMAVFLASMLTWGLGAVLQMRRQR